jgi:2-polyprenyl-3-methyl-5-hydroxy-6-metoxy-1,4-benzoquinol methylase
MIKFGQRLDSEKPVFKNILKRYPAARALDAGCGSGFHSILLAQLGLEVTGIDQSPDMLGLARKNARTYGVPIQFSQTGFLSFRPEISDNYDAVFCLGNSFVHLLTDNDQHKALNNFQDCLNRGGYLCMEIVNYDKILKEKRKVLAVRDIGKQRITRSYKFNEKTITFTVTIDSKEGKKKFDTELYPLKNGEAVTMLKDVGFINIEVYGNLKLESYDPWRSENLCLFCSQ